MIRRALERELQHVRGEEDVSVPQLIGRAFPRLPAGTALPEVREEAEDLLGVDKSDDTVEVRGEDPADDEPPQATLATDGGHTPLSTCNREGGE